ncbi:4Fe-4S binding protein [Porphyromonadaceae bacterium OttesenSCG-928-L07]|nr:4Fe-4S binding protein [Porphyromonadaceae bacterium OttesenSCG-928-L07]MDL2330800.1 4Fe-4S binding protein [Odoribacter sp. OttesenSCG-928-A06]
MLRPIYTEPDNCQDCYKCIRECPVKAIRIEDNKASIIEDRCVYCGHCTQVCPTGAKKIRDGLSRVKMTLAKESKVYLSLAPSYISEFPDTPSSVLIAAIKRLGFVGVSETALGAEIVSARTEDFLGEAEYGTYISSACPVVVEYIRKYSPEHIPNITPIVSPMLAHAMMLKQLYGEDIKVIFAGPCICKKLEADNFKDLIDVAITFKDLKAWFENEEINLDDKSLTAVDEKFVPYRSGLGSLYPIEGGMVEGLHKCSKSVHNMSFSDLPTIKDVLKELDFHRDRDSIFLELLACKGGCVNGPAKLSHASPALKRYEVVQKSEMGDPRNDFKEICLDTIFQQDTNIKEHLYSEEEIKQALAAVGKTSPEDELNCSGCGYDSCRDFATAMLEGRAEENMCASYMRKIAHDKATVLLQKIPAGVLLVNSELHIVDMNQFCASSMGEDIEAIYEASPGLSGVPLKNICSFDDLFHAVLTTGKEIKERQVKENNRTWILSIYNIQPHRLVFGLLQDLREPAVRKEWMLEKTREVIKNHMATVQQVACLLGENSAFTDATLRSIMDAYKDDDYKKPL